MSIHDFFTIRIDTNQLYNFLHFSIMGNDATLTGLIVEETDKVQNIKLSALKQSNIKSVFFFEVLSNER